MKPTGKECRFRPLYELPTHFFSLMYLHHHNHRPFTLFVCRTHHPGRELKGSASQCFILVWILENMSRFCPSFFLSFILPPSPSGHAPLEYGSILPFFLSPLPRLLRFFSRRAAGCNASRKDEREGSSFLLLLFSVKFLAMMYSWVFRQDPFKCALLTSCKFSPLSFVIDDTINVMRLYLNFACPSLHFTPQAVTYDKWLLCHRSCSQNCLPYWSDSAWAMFTPPQNLRCSFP